MLIRFVRKAVDTYDVLRFEGVKTSRIAVDVTCGSDVIAMSRPRPWCLKRFFGIWSPY